MERLQINIMVGIVSSKKCNVIFTFSLKFWRKYLCKTVIYDMLWMVFYQLNVPLIPLIGLVCYQLLY